MCCCYNHVFSFLHGSCTRAISIEDVNGEVIRLWNNNTNRSYDLQSDYIQKEINKSVYSWNQEPKETIAAKIIILYNAELRSYLNNFISAQMNDGEAPTYNNKKILDLDFERNDKVMIDNVSDDKLSQFFLDSWQEREKFMSNSDGSNSDESNFIKLRKLYNAVNNTTESEIVYDGANSYMYFIYLMQYYTLKKYYLSAYDDNPRKSDEIENINNKQKFLVEHYLDKQIDTERNLYKQGEKIKKLVKNLKIFADNITSVLKILITTTTTIMMTLIMMLTLPTQEITSGKLMMQT